ncbi:hypothetical protein Pan14r_46400 [Crateriforma conspicua]|uniref:Uncharacterized protein n=2 Tax=Crateriforma conspicua TaxID=2527996 RepID=A0A5C5YAB6_9PLAN|nr:hypothetical protein Pan14r_46400 [Crateriforma conspicua]
MQKLEPQAGQLAKIDRLAIQLAESDDLAEVAEIRDKCAFLQDMARTVFRNLDAQNRAAASKLRAERKAGKMLAAMRLRGGDRRSSGHGDRLKLQDLGISHNDSKRWQKRASIPDEWFEAYLATAEKLGEEISASGLERTARKAERAARSEEGLSVSANDGCARDAKDRPANENTNRPDDRSEVENPARGEEVSEPGPSGVALRGHADELLGNAKGHCDTLARLVSPLAQDPDAELLPATRRGLVRYVDELQRTLNELLNLSESKNESGS